MKTLLKTSLFFFLLIYIGVPVQAQEQTIRLKDVPLVEDVEGEKKKFKFDFRTFIPDNSESRIYLVTRFCYKGQNFIVRKRVSSPRFTFTVKYYVNQWLEIRINSYEGPAYCIGQFKINDRSLLRCNPLGMEAEWIKVDSTATDFKRS